MHPLNLQGKQLQVYTTVCEYLEAPNPSPLRIIVSGTARTGKSYLTHCLRLLLLVHATAPCSAHALAQTRPTMCYIPLVIHILGIQLLIRTSARVLPGAYM